MGDLGGEKRENLPTEGALHGNIDGNNQERSRCMDTDRGQIAGVLSLGRVYSNMM
ncbi:hypothetical protein HU200_055320 [Digitaria exilis]|uniref:Uncharacterized protein n=1 Tax=Digitaria exilis TaxID=1010633 RepID=A0A835AE87_9POAL|nr:hypothetical protein HU200_055320 [Digitaria exilis]